MAEEKAEKKETPAPPPPPPPPPEKSDYESLLTSIVTMEPVIKKINSKRLIEKLGDFKRAVEEELKELVYQEYKKPS